MTVVVTGVSAITALGAGARETWARVVAGERAFAPLRLFDGAGMRTSLVAEVPPFDPPRVPGATRAAEASRTGELAVHAAREAISDSGIDVRGARVGLVVGGTTAGMFETESLLAVLLSPEGAVDEAARTEALSKILSHPLSAPTDLVARELGPFARVRSLSSACSSGANALALGAAWIELGLVDAVVCGAAESLCRMTLSGFNALGALDPDGARPFDVARRGLTLGEGAGFVVLETRARAAARGKRALCTLLGWASRAEAHHITNPEPSGEAPFRAMAAALARAGKTAADVDYVNAHGTGTPLNDAMESQALARLFGADLARVRVSSQKGQIGHTLGAAGAIEAVLTALAIAHGTVPPTGGLRDPDPACPLNHVTTAVAQPIRVAISSSFGFGGMDAILVMGAADEESPSRSAPASSLVVTGIGALTPCALLAGEAVADLPTITCEASVVGAALEAKLDPERARRLDRSSRLAVVATEAALADAALASPEARRETGIVLGSAFGAVDGTAAFMRRVREKGPRLASPADFPSLVPSSPAGHTSIYLGLGGPTSVVADLATSPECALLQAAELVRAGELDRVCVVGVEERSAIVEAVFSLAFGGTETTANTRREGAATIVLERADRARARGARALAEVAAIVSFTDDEAEVLAALPPPPASAIVVLGVASEANLASLARTPWAASARVVCSGACGTHEAVSAMAIAVAAAKVARGEVERALFLGTARGWGYAGIFARPIA